MRGDEGSHEQMIPPAGRDRKEQASLDSRDRCATSEVGGKRVEQTGFPETPSSWIDSTRVHAERFGCSFRLHPNSWMRLEDGFTGTTSVKQYQCGGQMSDMRPLIEGTTTDADPRGVDSGGGCHIRSGNPTAREAHRDRPQGASTPCCQSIPVQADPPRNQKPGAERPVARAR